MSAALPQVTIGLSPVEILLRENHTGASPRHATRVRLSRSSESLVVEFECVGLAPWSTLTQRDSKLWEEEVVEIFVDPVGDGLGYFEIEVNPLGTICDLVLRRIASGWRRDFAWDCEGLEVRTERRADGWSARLRLPLRTLSLGLPASDEVWRMNFCRIDRPGGPAAPRELSAWSPTGHATFHDPDRFGRVIFGAT